MTLVSAEADGADPNFAASFVKDILALRGRTGA
jgi:hypothetical protein